MQVQARTAYNAGMQYTLRNIPKALDRALRQLARRQGRSLNAVAIEALARACGIAEEPVQHRDLTGIAGSWREDPEFDAAIADQHVIDEDAWR